MDIPAIVSLVLMIVTVVFAAIVVISALLGLRKSWRRSIIKLGRTVTAIILAFVAAKLIIEFVPIGELIAPLVNQLLSDASEFNEFIQTSPTLYAFVCNVPLAIIMPSLFISLYFLFNALLGIPTIFVKKAVLRKERKARAEAKDAKKALKKAKKADKKAAKAAKKGKEAEAPVYDEAELKKTIKAGKIGWGSRFLSAGIKATNTVVFLALMLLPLACIITTIGQGALSIKDEMVAADADITIGEGQVITSEQIDELCDDYVEPIVKNPVIVVAANPLSRAIFTSLTEVNVAGTECYLDRELSDIFALVGNATHLLVAPEDYDDEQKDAIANIIDYIANSEFRCTLSSELFSAVASKWQNGELFFGIANPATEDLSPIFDPLLEILAESTPESVEKDLHTFSHILGIFIDYDMFATVADTLGSENPIENVKDIASSDFLNDILLEIYSNEDYKMMTQPVVRFAFNALLAAFNAEPMGPAEGDTPDLTEEQIRDEADAICAIILSAVEFIESIPEEETDDVMQMISDINMGALGAFYDNSQHSVILKDGFHDTFIAILKSENLDSMRGVCDIIIDHIENDPELKMENLLLATQELTGIFLDYQNGDFDTDKAALSKKLGSLINKVDSHTATIVNDILKTDSFKMDMLSGENGEQVTKLLTTVIDTMASLDGLTEEELEKEAKAIDYVLKIVTIATEPTEGEELESIFQDVQDNPEEMIDTMVNSKLVTSAITAIAYDENNELTEDALALSESVTEEDKENVINAAENYYKENVSEMTAEEKETLKTNMNAIASIFGNDLTADFAQWDIDING